MTFIEFTKTLSLDQPPDGLTPYLNALWQDGKGDWKAAHETVQEIEDRTAARIHAYLHRKEGDESNARYWYSQAHRDFPAGLTLDEEWQKLVIELLN